MGRSLQATLGHGLLVLAAFLAITTGREVAADEAAEAGRCMALALYWEARDEGREGMIAVGSVVLNRVESLKFPDDVCAVVEDGGESPPCQFSYWCDGRRDAPEPGAQWTLAQAVAAEMLTQRPQDPTGGALFFHSIDDAAPWQRQRRRTARIGRHIYYR